MDSFSVCKSKVPLNNKATYLERQISIDREETETGLEALEEPLKARRRRESRQGRTANLKLQLVLIIFCHATCDILEDFQNLQAHKSRNITVLVQRCFRLHDF